MFSIPIGQAESYVTGAAAGVPIALPTAHDGDKILAVVKFKDGGRAVVGLNPAAFTLGANTISSATEDTSGWTLAILRATQPVDAE